MWPVAFSCTGCHSSPCKTQPSSVQGASRPHPLHRSLKELGENLPLKPYSKFSLAQVTYMQDATSRVPVLLCFILNFTGTH